MSRTIAGPFLAFALVIAPSFYCAPSWAQVLRGAGEGITKGLTKVLKEVAPKFKEEAKEFKEKSRDLWEKVPEPVRDKLKGLPGDLGTECFKEARKEGTCMDASE
jgi:hypothetical protein